MRSYVFGALALLLALSPSGIVFGATAGAQPSPPPWLDPFCAIHVNAVAWNPAANAPDASGKSSTYRLQLISQKAGSVLDAHVSLADDADIFTARVRSAPLTGKPYELQTPAYLVTLPKVTTLAYGWVASYYVDDTPQVACPAEVSTIGPLAGGPALSPPDSGKTLTATLSRSVGTLACGHVYVAPKITKGPQKTDVQPSAQPEEYQQNNSMWQPLETDPEVVGVHRKDIAYVVVFLDLEGMPVNAYLSQSTGVNDEDKIALQAAQQAAYAPATFLCSPTVSHYVFEAPFKQ